MCRRSCGGVAGGTSQKAKLIRSAIITAEALQLWLGPAACRRVFPPWSASVSSSPGRPESSALPAASETSNRKCAASSPQNWCPAEAGGTCERKRETFAPEIAGSHSRAVHRGRDGRETADCRIPPSPTHRARPAARRAVLRTQLLGPPARDRPKDWWNSKDPGRERKSREPAPTSRHCVPVENGSVRGVAPSLRQLWGD